MGDSPITTDEARVDEMISQLQEEMNYLMAVKKWNAMKKTVNTEHVWAVPRRNTKEYDEVKAMYAPKAEPVPEKIKSSKYIIPKTIRYEVEQPAPLPKQLKNPEVTYNMIQDSLTHKNVKKVYLNNTDLVEEVRQLKNMNPKQIKEWDQVEADSYYKLYDIPKPSTRNERWKQITKILEDQLVELVNKNI